MQSWDWRFCFPPSPDSRRESAVVQLSTLDVVAASIMTTLRLCLLILYEVISVFIIFRLWTRKQRPRIIERCLLSLVLLIPIFGWVFYIFLKSSPDAHGEDVGDHSTGGGVGDTGHH